MENKETMRDWLHCSGMASICAAQAALHNIWDVHFCVSRVPEDFAGEFTYLQELLLCCIDALGHGVDLLEAEDGEASERFLDECMRVVALNGPCGDVTEEQVQARSGDVAQPQGTEGGRLIDAMRKRPGFGEALFAAFHSFTDAGAFDRFMDEWEERRNEC